MLVVLYWLLLGLIIYSLFGYGLIWMALAALFGQRRSAPEIQSPGLKAIMLIAARNEAATIRAKLQTVFAQDCGPHKVHVLVVSDGSDDATLDEALHSDDPRVTAFQTKSHVGKAAALNAGLARIDAGLARIGTPDIVIFSDANSLLATNALRYLLQPFADPHVGGVCGRPEPINRKGGWLARVERLFWAYDSGLKRAESALGGAVSAQGTLYAIRRELRPDQVPAAMADDFYISAQVPARGKRLVFEPRAIAREEVTVRVSDEFMRRVRSTERGWRALMQMARLMNPGQHGLYAIQLASHKALRRLVAFLLPLLFLVNLAIIGQSGFYAISLTVQVLCYLFAIAAIISARVRALPGAGLAAFFVLGHLAMGYGILRAAFGVRSARWSPVREVSQ